MEWFLSGTTGWVLTALIFIGVFFTWRTFRKRKANKVSKHWPPITVLGFGGVNVPKWRNKEEIDFIPFEEAEALAVQFSLVQRDVWQKCFDMYGVTTSTNEAFSQPARGWCVEELGITNDPAAMPDKHPFVHWGMPHGGINLLLQKDMFYWYAHEVHNVFRYLLHGPLHIYHTVDAEDLRWAREIQQLINDEYPADTDRNRFPDDD